MFRAPIGIFTGTWPVRPELIAEYLPLITDSGLKDLIGKGIADFDRQTAPRLSSLRRSVIFNDANNYNVLVAEGSDLFSKEQRVVGIIDFGDMVFSYTIGDLAVAIAYAILDKPDPLDIAARIAAAFHAVFPIEEKEFDVLFDLVRLRLCLSACLAVYQQGPAAAGRLFVHQPGSDPPHPAAAVPDPAAFCRGQVPPCLRSAGLAAGRGRM